MMLPLRSRNSHLILALGRTKIETGPVTPAARVGNKVVSVEKLGRAPRHLEVESLTSGDSGSLFDLLHMKTELLLRCKS